MIGSIILHAGAVLALITLIAWAVSSWLSLWLGLTLWLIGAAVVAALVVFARGALGPQGGG